MFELTGALSHTIPIMLAIMISKWLADFLCRASIYEKMIGLNGHQYLDQKREYFDSRLLILGCSNGKNELKCVPTAKDENEFTTGMDPASKRFMCFTVFSTDAPSTLTTLWRRQQPYHNVDAERIQRLSSSVSGYFPHAEKAQGASARYRIPHTDAQSAADVLEIIQKTCLQHNLKDLSVSPPSLDQIFVDLTSKGLA
ncbi:hypothetical protein BJ742DRAFT_864999 [Cladochytrium replicatum]|nr:hypothetical protein BJ742DRAFT_864999 [Cladochytrium replicatum]